MCLQVKRQSSDTGQSAARRSATNSFNHHRQPSDGGATAATGAPTASRQLDFFDPFNSGEAPAPAAAAAAAPAAAAAGDGGSIAELWEMVHALGRQVRHRDCKGRCCACLRPCTSALFGL